MTARRRTALAVLAAVAALALATVAPPAPAAAGSDRSGGKAVAHKAGGARVSAPNVPSAQMMEITVDGAPLSSAEPTLGVTKNGDVYYVAFQTNTRIEVAKSTDSGKTWKLASPKLGAANTHRLSLDPYIYVDKYTDRVFTIDLTVACSYLSFTDDGAKTWITNPLACGRPVNDHHTLFAGPPAHSPTTVYPNIVYYCWNDVGSSSCTKSLDGGLTFASTGSPAFTGLDPNAGGQSVPFCGGLHGHGFVGPDGTVLLPKGHCGQPWLAISRDEGATWERVQVAKNGVADHEADAVMDEKGNIYYVYIAADRLPYLVVSRDGGKKWSKPMMIGAPGVNEANLPAMDVGGVGKIAITYMGTENSPYRPGKEEPDQQKYRNTTWNGYMTVVADALDGSPTFYSGTVNDKSDPLMRGQCGPGRCGAVYDFIDIVVSKTGQVWAAFTDGCTAICASSGANAGAGAVVGRMVGGPSMR